MHFDGAGRAHIMKGKARVKGTGASKLVGLNLLITYASQCNRNARASIGRVMVEVV